MIAPKILVVVILCAAPEAKQRLKEAKPESRAGRFRGNGTRQLRCLSNRTESPTCVGNEQTTYQKRFFFNHTSRRCQEYEYRACPQISNGIKSHENSFMSHHNCHLLCIPDPIPPR